MYIMTWFNAAGKVLEKMFKKGHAKNPFQLQLSTCWPAQARRRAIAVKVCVVGDVGMLSVWLAADCRLFLLFFNADLWRD
jgi:hypothetical protein